MLIMYAGKKTYNITSSWRYFLTYKQIILNKNSHEMDGAEAKYMRKKVKTGEIEVDLENKAIIVNYEVEATVLGSNGEPMLCEKKNNQKRSILSMPDI
jgi:Kinesin-associated protein (KAP)